MLLVAVALLVPLIPLRAIPAQATGYSGTILSDSPIAYWRLGETSGTAAADATGHGNTGTYTGAAGAYTLGQPGALFGDADTATKLDGQAGHVLVPNSIGLQTNQVSIELWIKKLAETPWGTYVSKNITNGGGAGTGWFQLLNYGSTGRLQFRVTGEDATRDEIQQFRPLPPVHFFTVDYPTPVVEIVPPASAVLGGIDGEEPSEDRNRLVLEAAKRLNAAAG